MAEFIKTNIVAIIFGCTTFIFSLLTLIYKIKEHRAKIQGLLKIKKNISVYLTRESLLIGLREIYSKATNTDEIWGQCIGCHNYSDDVKEIILEKAALGVHFRIIVNSNATTKIDFKNLFDPLRNASVRESSANAIRLHGLSSSEVIIGFSTITGLVALHVRETVFVSIIKNYFDQRWNDITP